MRNNSLCKSSINPFWRWCPHNLIILHLGRISQSLYQLNITHWGPSFQHMTSWGMHSNHIQTIAFCPRLQVYVLPTFQNKIISSPILPNSYNHTEEHLRIKAHPFQLWACWIKNKLHSSKIEWHRHRANIPTLKNGIGPGHEWDPAGQTLNLKAPTPPSVSYTHLTLPTT